MALFRRRQPLTFLQKARCLIWPPIGFRRYAKYLALTLLRMKASSYSLAAGLATGAAISFTPLLGGHILLSLAVCWVIRANFPAAVIGTLVGNPWTFPFIWFFTYKIGIVFLNWFEGIFPSVNVPSEWLVGISSLGTATLTREWKSLLMPMMIGAIPVAIMVWMISFFTAVWLVKKMLHKRKSLMDRE